MYAFARSYLRGVVLNSVGVGLVGGVGLTFGADRMTYPRFVTAIAGAAVVAGWFAWALHRRFSFRRRVPVLLNLLEHPKLTFRERTVNMLSAVAIFVVPAAVIAKFGRGQSLFVLLAATFVLLVTCAMTAYIYRYERRTGRRVAGNRHFGMVALPSEGDLELIADAFAGRTAWPNWCPPGEGRHSLLHSAHAFLHFAGRYDEAAAIGLSDEQNQIPCSLGPFNAACSLALALRPDEAIAALQRAIALGHARSQLETDTDLDSLRTMPGYVTLIDADQ